MEVGEGVIKRLGGDKEALLLEGWDNGVVLGEVGFFVSWCYGLGRRDVRGCGGGGLVLYGDCVVIVLLRRGSCVGGLGCYDCLEWRSVDPPSVFPPVTLDCDVGLSEPLIC